MLFMDKQTKLAERFLAAIYPLYECLFFLSLALLASPAALSGLGRTDERWTRKEIGQMRQISSKGRVSSNQVREKHVDSGKLMIVV